MARRIVVMGVAGCGKSLVGRLLASHLALPFIEADTLHPRENIAKMAQGIALQDEDRWAWLHAVGEALARPDDGAVTACSALKRRYRDVLRAEAGALDLVHLVGDRALIGARVARRRNHFMAPSLMESQFAALEPPGPDEGAIVLSVDQSPEAIAVAATTALAAR